MALRKIKSRLRTETGSILIMSAVSMAALLSVAAFVFSVGMAYDKRNQLSAAADSAARSAGFAVLKYGDTASDTALTNLAQNAVFYYGDASTNWLNGATVTARRCNAAGATCATPHQSKTYVEVVVSQPSTRFLGSFLSGSLTPSARAVSGFANGESCLITLGGLGSTPYSLNVDGSSTLTLTGCGVQVNGDITGKNQNSVILADAGVSVVGSSCAPGGTCSGMGAIEYNAPGPIDPFEKTISAIPTLTGCVPAPSSGNLDSTKCYTTMTVDGIVTLAPGPNYFTGTVTFKNGSSPTIKSGTGGSTLVIANGGSLDGSNSATLDITAPSTGLFAGVAVYQPSTNTNPVDFKNGVTWNVKGATYLPGAKLTFKNGYSTTSDCAVFVVKAFEVGGGQGKMTNTCDSIGGNPIKTIALAE